MHLCSTIKIFLKVDLIIDCQKCCKQTYSCRRTRRWIQRQIGKKVNLKAILRQDLFSLSFAWEAVQSSFVHRPFSFQVLSGYFSLAISNRETCFTKRICIRAGICLRFDMPLACFSFFNGNAFRLPSPLPYCILVNRT